jgi:hypothetical protein
LFLEHPYRNGWYAKVNYTLSRNKGNTEGQTLSDTATAQGDVAATQTWDYPELMSAPTACCRTTASTRSRPSVSTTSRLNG